MGIGLLGPLIVGGGLQLEPRDRIALSVLAVRRGPGRVAGRARGRAVAARPAGDVAEAGADLRRAAAQGARRRPRSRRCRVDTGWRSTRDDLDTARFERLAERGRALGGDAASRSAPPSAYARALELWRGHPLEELDGWPPGPQRGGPAGGAAPHDRGGPARRAPGGRRAPAGGGRRRGARRRGAVAGAAVGDPGARALPLRAPGRRAEVDPRRPGARWWRSSAWTSAPSSSRSSARSCARTRRWRRRRSRPPSARRARTRARAVRRGRRGRASSGATPRSPPASSGCGPARCSSSPARRAAGSRRCCARGWRRRCARGAVALRHAGRRSRAAWTVPWRGRSVARVDRPVRGAVRARAARRARSSNAARASARARVVVIAVRSDHLGSLARRSRSSAGWPSAGLHLVSPLAGAALREAIEQPALRAGLHLEPGLVDVLVRDSEGEPGALPLLSHALVETWKRRDGSVLTVDGYRETGGIRGAVARSADRLYDEPRPRAARDAAVGPAAARRAVARRRSGALPRAQPHAARRSRSRAGRRAARPRAAGHGRGGRRSSSRTRRSRARGRGCRRGSTRTPPGSASCAIWRRPPTGGTRSAGRRASSTAAPGSRRRWSGATPRIRT